MALVFLVLFGWAAQAQEQKPCAPCHNEQIADFATHKHSKTFECALCHGASEKHRASTGTVPPDKIAAPEEVPALCGNCHITERRQYMASKHFAAYIATPKVRTANCNTCHGHHAVRPFQAMVNTCNRCHVTTPAACKGKPVSEQAASRVPCMGCHSRHELRVVDR
ncbi:MAG: hypothetical protein FJW30_15885 [Acidobacteria bacterium]|nr:hypothetical protein [Acidobacteriota bacterium]